MTGRYFARKINIRFNCFGARTSRHCLTFLAPDSFFDLAPILGRIGGFIQAIRHNKNGDADAAATCEAHTANARLYFVYISRVAIVLVAREKNTAMDLPLEPKLEIGGLRSIHRCPQPAALVKLIEGCVDGSTIEAARASRCAVTMCQRRSSIYSATGRVPDTDLILAIARSHKPR